MSWKVNRKSKVEDLSMSVPMTLSERERRNARGHIFQGINLLMLEQFDLERPNSAGCDCDSAHFQESPLYKLSDDSTYHC